MGRRAEPGAIMYMSLPLALMPVLLDALIAGDTLGGGRSLWPYLDVLERLGLALALGLFIGFERERRNKEAGIRTFGFAALLGCLGALLGNAFALFSLGFLALLVIVLNLYSMSQTQQTELTTSAALLVVGFVGVLCGQGHTLTPTALAVATAALLASKVRLRGLSSALTEAELRAAILLGVLAFVIYPALPEGPVDPWGLIDPREAWVTVVLIAAIGFANYILLKLFGTRGVEIGGFLSGLINSKLAVTELANRTQESNGRLAASTYRGVALATAATIIRNGGLLLLLAPLAFADALIPFALMLLVSAGMMLHRGSQPESEDEEEVTEPRSPFSIKSALEFGLFFLILQVAGTLAQRGLGPAGFYVVSILGGLVSSASAVASAATLTASHSIPAGVAGVGVVLTTLTSILVNLLLFARISKDWSLTKRVAWATAVLLIVGIVGAVVQRLLPLPDRWLS